MSYDRLLAVSSFLCAIAGLVSALWYVKDPVFAFWLGVITSLTFLIAVSLWQRNGGKRWG